MNIKRLIHSSFLALIALSVSGIASADMTLDATSSTLNFISVKNEHIAESHTFDSFSGGLSDTGKLTINIDLSSVNTLIPIRNERMQKMLFDMANFSTASFTADIDSELLKLKSGESKRVSVSGNLNISGKTVPTTFDVRLVGLGNGISATTVKPTIISTTSFGLDAGVAALQEIAMLKSISNFVPLTFSVVFK